MPGIDSFTKLLLHCNGADTSTSFPDSSFSAHSVTANGNAQVDTAESQFGGASALFDGSGDFLEVPDNADWAFGTGDWTIDFWVRFNSVSGFQFLYHQGTTNDRLTFFKDPTNAIQFVSTVGGTNIANFETPASVVTTNVWYHIALVRSGNDQFIFIDGVSQSLTITTDPDSSTDYPDLSQTLQIGRNEFGNFLNGWVDEYRVSKGIARFTSNFTPPTQEYSEDQLTIDINETILINDSNNVTTNPETIQVNENILLNDQNVIFIPLTAKFASQIISVNPLYIVTDEDPAQIVEVDISDPLNPMFTEHVLVGAKNAKQIAINTVTNFLYVACADGLVVKVDVNDLSIQTIIDLNDTDNLETIGVLSAFGITYTGTENTEAELYSIDERETEILNTDFTFLEQDTVRMDTSFDFTEAEFLDTDFKFLSQEQILLQTDFKFLEDAFDTVACNPIKRTDFHVFIDNVELVSTDLDLKSININDTVGEQSEASFILTRRHDDLNTNLDGSTITITNQNTVRIEIKDIIRFEGKISELNTIYQQSLEQIEVTAISEDESETKFNNVELPLPSLDEKLNIYHILVQNPTIFNPPLNETDEDPKAFKGVLADLGAIERESRLRLSSFQDGNALADDIIDGTFNQKQNFTYFWFMRGRLFKAPTSVTTTTEPNDGGGALDDGFLPVNEFPVNEFPDFDFTTNSFQSEYTDFTTELAVQRYVGTSLSNLSADLWELISASWKKQRIFENEIELSIITEEFEGGGSTFTLDKNPSFGFSSVREVLVNGFPVDFTFNNPNQVIITDGTTNNDTVTIEYGIRDFAVGEAPFQQISVRNGIFIPKELWVDKTDGFFREKEDGFNFDEYVKEVVQLEFEKLLNINGDILPETSCGITTTIDALLYYDLNILTRINIDNTTKANIYKNNNGFPVSIKSINISSGNMNITLTCDNLKSNEELDAIDGRFPDENDDKFNTSGFSVKVHTKLDLASRETVE